MTGELLSRSVHWLYQQQLKWSFLHCWWQRHTKSEYMGLSSMTIILPIVPLHSLPNQQSAVLAPVLPLQRIVYFYPICPPYGQFHTAPPMAVRLLSTSTMLLRWYTHQSSAFTPLAFTALHTSFISVCVVAASFSSVSLVTEGKQEQEVYVVYVFLSNTLILYSKYGKTMNTTKITYWNR